MEKAVPAMLDAWLNLSHREKASELVMVKAIAMAIQETLSVNFSPTRHMFSSFRAPRTPYRELTHKRQPNKHEAHQGQHRQRDPQQRLDVVGQPEETTVGRIDGLGAGLAALKDPFGVARGRVHLVPPPQADEATPSDVFEIVEVGGEKEDRDDEDKDAVGRDSRSVDVDLSSSARRGSRQGSVGGGGGRGGVRTGSG